MRIEGASTSEAALVVGASVIYTFDERFPSDSVELRS